MNYDSGIADKSDWTEDISVDKNLLNEASGSKIEDWRDEVEILSTS